LVDAFDQGDGVSDGALWASTTLFNNDITLHWVASSTGEIYFGSDYGTLSSGDAFTSTHWYEGDRMALVNSDKQCLGVLDLSAENNSFVINNSLFE